MKNSYLYNMKKWTKIEGFDGYEINEDATVRRWHRWPNKDGVIECTILKPNKLNKKNYYLIRLYKDGKQYPFLLHRLVAKTFLPNPNNFPIVMHKDDNGFNCSADNLEWGTISKNTKQAFDRGLISKTRKKNIKS